MDAYCCVIMCEFMHDWAGNSVTSGTYPVGNERVKCAFEGHLVSAPLIIMFVFLICFCCKGLIISVLLVGIQCVALRLAWSACHSRIPLP